MYDSEDLTGPLEAVGAWVGEVLLGDWGCDLAPGDCGGDLTVGDKAGREPFSFDASSLARKLSSKRNRKEALVNVSNSTRINSAA